MFNPNSFDNARSNGIAVLEILPERPETGEPRGFVPLKRTEAGGEILGPLAAMTVTHVYGYTREQCDRVLEALYRFPLPGDAAVTGVTVSFGSVEIRAELRERAKAEAEYAEARQRGHQATLVTRESPDVFTLRVAGLQPDEDVTIVTSYVQLAAPEGAGWSLRLPLATAPRYVRSDELASAQAHGQPLALLRDPGHRFSLDLLIPGAGAVESPTHPLEVSDEEGMARVRLRDRLVLPDRDCVLAWRMEQREDRPALRVFTHEDAASGKGYFLALLAPPASPDPDSAVPREAILLVDHSGSMEGPKREAADWAVRNFLAGLTERDLFGLEVFDTSTRWFGKELKKGDAATVEAAGKFLSAEQDGGGTELGVALEQALRVKRSGGERSRHLLILTDAQVSDEGRILRLAQEESRRKDRRRISVLCIDSAPNAFLALQIAQRGGGVARFLSSSPEHGDITTALEGVLLDWARPALAGLQLEVDQPGVEAPDREVVPARESGSTAVDLGDLPAGRALWLAGRLPLSGRAPEFRVTASEGRVVAAARGEPAGGRALKALFGARRVQGLEFLINSGYPAEVLAAELARIGYDPKEALAPPAERPAPVYAENAREANREALGGLLLRESLEYGLLTSATGFVAVRLEAGRPVEESVVVAGALPLGWDEEFLTTPSAAPVQGMQAQFMLAPFAMPPASPRGRTLRHSGGGASRSTFMDAMTSGSAAPGSPPSGRSDAPSMSEAMSTYGEPTEGPPRPEAATYSGEPDLRSGEFVLFEAEVRGGGYSRLRVRLPRGPKVVDPGLRLLIFVGDMASPVVRTRLVDVLRQHGERPVNLSVPAGTRVKLLLLDPRHAWAAGAPRLEVELV